MSTNLYGLIGPPHQVLLSWPDETRSTVVEQTVEILEATIDQAVIRTDVQVRKETPVLLRACPPVSGIVDSCLIEGSAYVVTIQFRSESQGGLQCYVDPAALVVDSYMTEEQEADILNDFAKESGLALKAESVLPCVQTSALRTDPPFAHSIDVC